MSDLVPKQFDKARVERIKDIAYRLYNHLHLRSFHAIFEPYPPFLYRQNPRNKAAGREIGQAIARYLRRGGGRRLANALNKPGLRNARLAFEIARVTAGDVTLVRHGWAYLPPLPLPNLHDRRSAARRGY